MTELTKNSEGKWTERPAVPGSVTWLKRQLEEKNRRLVAAHDVIVESRSSLDSACEGCHNGWLLAKNDLYHVVKDELSEEWEVCSDPDLRRALEAYDKAMEKENG